MLLVSTFNWVINRSLKAVLLPFFHFHVYFKVSISLGIREHEILRNLFILLGLDKIFPEDPVRMK